MRKPSTFLALCLFVLFCRPLPAQDIVFATGLMALHEVPALGGPAKATAAAPVLAASTTPAYSSSLATALALPPSPRIVLREPPPARFDFQAAVRQSSFFMGIEHGFRLTQRKTRRELGGPFFQDYWRSVQGIRGWHDGDGVFANYVAHPMQGAVSGYIQVQNDPRGMFLEYNQGREYWNSRLRALAWAAYYSTVFEVGPVSEATLGNVGKNPGTNGLTDFVVTPLGGFGLMLLEDRLDRWVARLEERTPRARYRRFYRVLFNPTRSAANMMRGRVPWHRDTRSMEYLGAVQAELDAIIEAGARAKASRTAD